MRGLVLVVLAHASDPFSYNGGSVLAMGGKQCVVVVADKRLGAGNALIGEEACRVLDCGRSVVAMRGLHGDVQTMLEDLDVRLRLHHLETGRRLEPNKLAALLSNMLYAGRAAPFFVEPVVAGLKGATPYLCGMDSLGAQLVSDTYVVAGTAAYSLHGACEALYRPDLDPAKLVDLAVRCMAAGLNRDCLSGRSVVVHLITDDGLVVTDRALADLAPA